LDGTEDTPKAILAAKLLKQDAVRLGHEQLVWHIYPSPTLM
jgi:hypothetical protein